ncbi:MAG: DegT/DnrJ/EryC1/StrS family aminotransferase [Rhodocyclaceae bacterium]|nr:DegT/DnrJ/EryC1/StrS family aminotransferase [Rhodocyclaceae bacterium]
MKPSTSDCLVPPAHCPPSRRPVLGWASFTRVDTGAMSGFENLRHAELTTSGRAAIYQALLQLHLPVQSSVLVPTYHCPTMIAPVLMANLNPVYFGLTDDGLPNLATIDAVTADGCKAMIVSHYFGFSRSLAEVRQWCDQRGIALIEDCAHCYFGNAGNRPVGAWGDFATASLTKFFPVPEAGVLASAHHDIPPLRLSPPGLKAQLRGLADVLELSAEHKRFAGINSALRLLFWLKRSLRRTEPKAEAPPASATENMMQDCDMARIAQGPLWVSSALMSVLPRGRVMARRRENFALYARHFDHVLGARPLFSSPPESAAPYVFPLWVDEPDQVYLALREQGLPVFRWDRIWPGTPHRDGDVGPLWSHHVLQLLCHQDLTEADIERTCRAILSALPPAPASAISAAH